MGKQDTGSGEARGRPRRWLIIAFVVVPSLVVVAFVALMAESFIRYSRAGIAKVNVAYCRRACVNGFEAGATDCSGFDPALDAYERPLFCEDRASGPTIVSYGRDGKPGGTRFAGDIACWRVEADEPKCECEQPMRY